MLREGARRSSSPVNDLSQAMGGESDAASFGRIVYWGVVLGLAVLLIAQPSRLGRRSKPATIAGIVVLSVAACHFLISLIRSSSKVV
jgi:hypothetical protein